MIATRDPIVASRARTMRTHGLNRDAFDRFSRVGASWSYDIVAAGFKYNLTDLAAAIGLAQLERVYEFQARREAIAERYLRHLADLPIDLPARAPENGLHAWHLFPIRIRSEARASSRRGYRTFHGKGHRQFRSLPTAPPDDLLASPASRPGWVFSRRRQIFRGRANASALSGNGRR